MTETLTATKPHGTSKPHGSTCGAHGKTSGTPCKRAAGWGTEHLGYGHCKLHGGASPGGKKYAQRLEMAELPILMGLPTDTEPHDAIMEAVWRAKGRVDYCAHRVALASTAEEMALPTPSGNAEYWLNRLETATEQLARYGKMAVDAGVSVRQVEVAERFGGLIGHLLRDVLGDLNLTAAQQERAPEVVQRHLELVAGQVV